MHLNVRSDLQLCIYQQNVRCESAWVLGPYECHGLLSTYNKDRNIAVNDFIHLQYHVSHSSASYSAALYIDLPKPLLSCPTSTVVHVEEMHVITGCILPAAETVLYRKENVNPLQRLDFVLSAHSKQCHYLAPHFLPLTLITPLTAAPRFVPGCEDAAVGADWEGVLACAINWVAIFSAVSLGCGGGTAGLWLTIEGLDSCFFFSLAAIAASCWQQTSEGQT